MSRPRKYRQGRRIQSVHGLIREIKALRYVMWMGRPVHPGWIGSMRFWTLNREVSEGRFHYAKEAAQ